VRLDSSIIRQDFINVGLQLNLSGTDSQRRLNIFQAKRESVGAVPGIAADVVQPLHDLFVLIGVLAGQGVTQRRHGLLCKDALIVPHIWRKRIIEHNLAERGL
jgi:hypothetical protein